MIPGLLLVSMLMAQNPQACPFTYDENHTIIPGPGCTKENMFVKWPDDLRPTIVNPGVGQAICPANLTPPPPPPVLESMSFDASGVPRPNRPPNGLFPGDTGCDIGAFQFVLPVEPEVHVITLRLVPAQ